MQTGLLWFDSDPNRELAAKVLEAARRYREKFGVAPDTCYVNEGLLQEGELRISFPPATGNLLRVLPASNVLLHHFWVGIEEQREAA